MAEDIFLVPFLSSFFGFGHGFFNIFFYFFKSFSGRVGHISPGLCYERVIIMPNLDDIKKSGESQEFFRIGVILDFAGKKR
jgi:hypothetical protein